FGDFGVLDVFGDRIGAVSARDRHRRADQFVIARTRGDPAHERTVDLDDVERQFAQPLETLHAYAEIVQRDVAAPAAQRADQTPCVAETFDRRGFGDLEAQRCGRHRRGVDQTEQGFAETFRSHAAPGQVDAEARQLDAVRVRAQPAEQTVD